MGFFDVKHIDFLSSMVKLCGKFGKIEYELIEQIKKLKKQIEIKQAILNCSFDICPKNLSPYEEVVVKQSNYLGEAFKERSRLIKEGKLDKKEIEGSFDIIREKYNVVREFLKQNGILNHKLIKYFLGYDGYLKAFSIDKNDKEIEKVEIEGLKNLKIFLCNNDLDVVISKIFIEFETEEKAREFVELLKNHISSANLDNIDAEISPSKNSIQHSIIFDLKKNQTGNISPTIYLKRFFEELLEQFYIEINDVFFGADRANYAKTLFQEQMPVEIKVTQSVNHKLNLEPANGYYI